MDQNKIALLIDAENISYKYVEPIMSEIAKYGKVVISRFYGDVLKVNEKWNEKALDYAIKPMHQYNVASKKNSADMAMALDAMEIMYVGRVDTFFIVSSDSDFTPLASKLREGGMKVIGIGSEAKVTKAFKSSCNEFKFFEYIIDEDIPQKKKSDDNGIGDVIKEIIIENGENNKIQLSRIGDILLNRFSDFDSRKYGAKQLSTLVQTIEGLQITKDHTTDIVELTTKNPKEKILRLIIKILSKNSSKSMKYVKLIEEIRKVVKDFSYQEYGYTKFKKFVASFDELVTTKEFVRIKTK